MIRAFASWTEDKRQHTASIECLYTNESDRGRGFGKALLKATETALAPGVTIYVRSTLNAQSFYEHQGYEYTGDSMPRAGFAIALLEKRPSSK